MKKNFEKKETIKLVIALLIVLIFPIVCIMQNGKIEKQRELVDLANLYAAKGCGMIEMSKNKNITDGAVLWYNPQTEKLQKEFIACGRGSQAKVSGVNYNDEKYVDFNYDGSETIVKGIKTTFHKTDNENICDVEFALVK